MKIATGMCSFWCCLKTISSRKAGLRNTPLERPASQQTRRTAPALHLGLGLLAALCSVAFPQDGHALPQNDQQELQPAGGDQLRGLTSEEIARFEAGRLAYQQTFSETEGLGPIFNSTSCAACHG